MIIKVCGMRDEDNIRRLGRLDVDWMGMIFYPRSPRYIDRPLHIKTSQRRAGVFVDEMPQTIISAVADYDLSIIQLHGSETPELVRNLRKTISPDLRKEITIVKAISVSTEDDIRKYKQYEDDVDYFLFDTKCKTVGGSGRQYDWNILYKYDGRKPFLLSGGIGPDDCQRILDFHHLKCAGIDLNSRFETAPGIKDIKALEKFVNEIRKNNKRYE